MIRNAVKEDIATLVQLGKEMHLESNYASLDFATDKVHDFLLYMMDYGVVLVEEKSGTVVGGIAGYISQPFFSNDSIATDLGLFISKQHRGGITAIKLIKSFTEWAIDHNVKQIRPAISVGGDVEGVTKLYERLGYKTAGAVFMMEN